MAAQGKYASNYGYGGASAMRYAIAVMALWRYGVMVLVWCGVVPKSHSQSLTILPVTMRLIARANPG